MPWLYLRWVGNTPHQNNSQTVGQLEHRVPWMISCWAFPSAEEEGSGKLLVGSHPKALYQNQTRSVLDTSVSREFWATDLGPSECTRMLWPKVPWFLKVSGAKAQWAQLSALCRPRGVGWGCGGGGRPRREGHVYSWFTLVYNRNEYNIIKQLYSNNKISNKVNEERREREGEWGDKEAFSYPLQGLF